MAVVETGCTAVEIVLGIIGVWLVSLMILPERAGETDAALVVGEFVFDVIVEVTGIDDLFTAVVDAFPKEDVDAVLKAGLAEGGVPKTPMVVVGAGVLMTIGEGAFVLGRMGLRLLVLFRIGVSL